MAILNDTQRAALQYVITRSAQDSKRVASKLLARVQRLGYTENDLKRFAYTVYFLLQLFYKLLMETNNPGNCKMGLLLGLPFPLAQERSLYSTTRPHYLLLSFILFHRTLHWVRSAAPIIIHINLDRVLKFLVKDTHYRNRFETGTSGGSTDKVARKSWEVRLS